MNPASGSRTIAGIAVADCTAREAVSTARTAAGPDAPETHALVSLGALFASRQRYDFDG